MYNETDSFYYYDQRDDEMHEDDYHDELDDFQEYYQDPELEERYNDQDNFDDDYSLNESELLREQIAAQEAGLAPRPEIDLDIEDEYYDMESIPKGRVHLFE